MRRTLLVTNDFPPRQGGIQSYLYELTQRLDPDRLVVYAPRWEGADEFDAAQPFAVVRHPTSLMLPGPTVLRRARELLSSYDCDAVWFGAAAPLGVLAPALRRAGAQRVVASAHGHEVGWAMTPGGRAVLRKIGRGADAVTYVSRYTRSRFASALGPMTALEHLPSGVDSARFRPDSVAAKQIRERYGLGQRPLIVCVSRLVARKGQDTLVRALPRIREQIPDASLLLVGDGPYRQRLQRIADRMGVADYVVCAGSVPAEDLPAHHCAADVFAMPCRTRGRGLDVEGLGIVFLEASASGVPVVAGNSGGAPETVRDGETGYVVDGRSICQTADAIAALLADPDLRTRMASAGRDWATTHWAWDQMAAKLASLL